MTEYTANKINQKEYLKKYLNIGNEKKRKKKVKKVIQNRVKIIDDTLDIQDSEILSQTDLEVFLTQEDAPQVVGVIDDRPLHLRIGDYRNNPKWRPVCPESPENTSSHKEGSSLKSEKIKNYDSDSSPIRRNKKYGSPNSKSEKQHKYDSDSSPVRKIRKPSPKYRSPNSKSEKQHKYDSDSSPVRKIRKPSPNRKEYKEINSSRKIKKYDSDSSPKRKSNSEMSHKLDSSKRRKSRWADRSPVSHPGPSSLESKERINSERQNRRSSSPKLDSDESPVRKNKPKNYSSENSDLRRYSSKSGMTKQSKSDSDESPIRKSQPRMSRSPNPQGKMSKTLDGKKSGLQNAKDLKKELMDFKNRENKLFSKMDLKEDSGPVIRDRKSGKILDYAEESQKEMEKLKEKQVQKQKYDLWGKGLSQVQKEQEKVEMDLKEMEKPLARYADDSDLEDYLKSQERDGDPMLEYMRKKKKSSGTKTKAEKPRYEGSFMPNRFGIPPGFRWDGVDRSNGYEKQWFSKENAKRALEEESYKWSIEDM